LRWAGKVSRGDLDRKTPKSVEPHPRENEL
jgi:hypothetical protein